MKIAGLLARETLATTLVWLAPPLTAAKASSRDLHLPTRSLTMPSQEISTSLRDIRMSVIDTVAVRETPAEIHVELPADILFDFDKAVIREAAQPALASAAAILRAHTAGSVEIHGHADAKGSDAHNLPLSLKRAEAVRRWLTDREGLRVDHLKTAGFGSRRPAVPNFKPDGSDDPNGRQRNRRVEIIIEK
ncbi:OmpA family protein [Lichenifustis flavocetrariae]|uniref:OmpA family protein n=1 Tax=Lichenifustis flavocetrariae TaxID=2949735 RepID=A0AA42CKJ2_9HYPH|nr:OmpA family protein [Lichenifustis flavocetrariae]MCW6509316.1 OmpA family protein [Lichenifustis flavocetrariae]